MRSVLISTDFVQRQDGTFTPVEINTDSGNSLGLDPNKSFIENYGDFFEHEEFFNFLNQNNFSKLILIDKTSGVHLIFKSFCEHYNIEFEKIIVAGTSISVPHIEDSEDTLIIRVAYDTYALIDDLYARDMFEFHNLIKDEEFASLVTFATGADDNIDTISEFELSQNGLAPNYVVKPRVPHIPGAQEGDYPKLYRFDNDSELNSLKSNLGVNEFIQKFEIDLNSLYEDRVTFIRSMDILYGPNLDTQHILSYKYVNAMASTNNLLVYENELNEDKSLNDLFGTKWYPTWFIRSDFSYHFDETDKILMSDGTEKDSKDLVNDDEVISISFGDDVIDDFEPHPLSALNNFELLPAKIAGVIGKPKSSIFINITAKDENENVFSWHDGASNFYLMEDNSSGLVQWIKSTAGSISIGDKIFVYDKISNTVKGLTIESYYYDLKPIPTYLISLDIVHQFLMKLGDTIDDDTQQKTSDLYLIQHNACRNQCGYIFSCYSTPTSQCSTCGKNGSYCPNCTIGGTPLPCDNPQQS